MQNNEEKIIKAAVQLFKEFGYTGMTMRKIANLADVNEVTIFRKFKSKENLLKNILEYFLENMKEQILEIRPEDPQMLNLMVQRSYNIQLEWYDLIIRILSLTTSNPEIRDWTSEFVSELMNIPTKQFRSFDNIPYDSIVPAIMLIGFIYQYMNCSRLIKNFDEENREKIFSDFVKILKNGLFNSNDKN